MEQNKFTEYSFLQNMAQDLLKPRKTNYSQESINYYFTPQKFYMEDLGKIYNRFNHNLKCTLVQHRTTIFDKAKRDSSLNSKCIIYLHGLGSNRLQAFTILPYLPKAYCLLAFDMSGSGKSQGDNTTYGYRQKDDIQSIIEYLNNQKKLSSFILWGRSMGAVAALLYSISLNQKIDQNNQQDKQRIKLKINKQQLVKCIVIDSPFCSFKQIAKQIGEKKLSIPKFVSQIALDILDSLFEKLLLDKKQKKSYNPFKIRFSQKIVTSMPAIFIHSMNDQIVPYTHSQKIIQLFQNKFQKIIIPQCGHNINRPSQVIQLIFQKLSKFVDNQNSIIYKRKYSLNLQKRSNKQNSDIQVRNKKRGISVCTSIQSNRTISPKKVNKRSNSDLQETKKKCVDEKINLSIAFKRRRTSDLKLKVTNSTKNLQNQFFDRAELFSTISYDNQISFSRNKDKILQRPMNEILNENLMNTIDVDMQGIINKKLQFNFSKKQGGKISRIYRQKKIKTLKTIDHAKITNDKYLY